MSVTIYKAFTKFVFSYYVQDADESEIKVQVCVYAFDLLYLNGESLVSEPFRRRRELLHSTFQEIEGEFVFAKAMVSAETEAVQEFLEEAIKGKFSLIVECFFVVFLCLSLSKYL